MDKRESKIMAQSRKRKKPNKKQIHELYAFYYSLNQDRECVRTEAFAENRKLLNFFKSVEPWVDLYAHPHVAIVMTLLKMIGCLEQFIDAATSEDKTQAIMKVINDLMESDLDDPFERFESLSESDKAVCFSLLLVTMKNLDALAAFGKTMDQLVAESSCDHEALFNAVLIDRSVVTHPVIAKKICMAEMIGDEGFMTELAKSVSKQRTRRKVYLDESRFMIELINDVFNLDSFTYEQITEVLVDDLQIFPDTGKDPLEAVKKNVQKIKKLRGK